MNDAEPLPELAFYYPDPMWAHGDLIKNLILFFDGIALLVPRYMKDRQFELDPAMAGGLREAGLLRILEPEDLIGRSETEALATALTDSIASAAFDRLSGTSQFHELSFSRLGYMTDPGLAEMILEELESRGLAKPTEDGLSVPLHPFVRSFVLVLLAQILRPRGRNEGVELSPATDRPEIQSALSEVLGLAPFHSAGHVVSRDLEVVGVDLSSRPLEEILEFKAEHGAEFRTYARDLREFVRSVGACQNRNRMRLRPTALRLWPIMRPSSRRFHTAVGNSGSPSGSVKRGPRGRSPRATCSAVFWRSERERRAQRQHGAK
jgi:hypothetical protein